MKVRRRSSSWRWCSRRAEFAKSQRAPMEYIFVVDVSGSMHGYPLEISKRVLRNLLGSLRPVDRFNVVLFAGCVSPCLASSRSQRLPAHLQLAMALIDSHAGARRDRDSPGAEEGGCGCPPPRNRWGGPSSSRPTGMLTSSRQVFDLIATHLGHANFFTFGIGTSVNRFLIEGHGACRQGGTVGRHPGIRSRPGRRQVSRVHRIPGPDRHERAV